ncbi:MAG: histidinol-phosphate transaminase [Chloroflexota bacterium]
MSLSPRSELSKISICPHGGLPYAELAARGLKPEEVLDFSVNTNPFPPPPGVKEVLSRVAVERYPDPESTELRLHLAERLGVAPENIIAGNGAVEILRHIALAYFGPGDGVLILEPTFGEYRLSVQIAGARVLEYRAPEKDGFAIDTEEVVSLIRKHRPRGVFICNPNNPTGQYLSRREIEKVVDALGEGLLILDEAFIAFVAEGWSALELVGGGRVVLVRSLTKDFALAGLRLGYAVAEEEVIQNLRRLSLPWSVNVVAQAAGVAALEDGDYLERCLSQIMEARGFLVRELGLMGFSPVPSKTHFFLLKVGDAGRLRRALLKRGILVRDCASFGLPEYLRIAPRTLPECRRLITTVHELKQKGELDDI